MIIPDLGIKSYRFERDLVAFAALTLLGGLSIWKGSDPALVIAVLGPLASFAGYSAQKTNMHDTTVRTELIRADKDKAIAGASGDLAKTSSQDLPRTP